MTRTKLIESFLIAIKGIFYEILEERNIKIQMIIGLIIILISIALKIPKIYFIVILLVCFLVIILELLNKCFERLIDLISPDYHEEFGKIKDIAAGAVLLSVILSVIIGLLILYEPMMNALKLAPKSVLTSLIVIDILLVAIILLAYYIKKK